MGRQTSKTNFQLRFDDTPELLAKADVEEEEDDERKRRQCVCCAHRKIDTVQGESGKIQKRKNTESIQGSL